MPPSKKPDDCKNPTLNELHDLLAGQKLSSIAKKIGYKIPTISLYLRGERRIPADFLESVRREYGEKIAEAQPTYGNDPLTKVYKDLSESRLEIINEQKEKIAELKEQLAAERQANARRTSGA